MQENAQELLSSVMGEAQVRSGSNVVKEVDVVALTILPLAGCCFCH